MPQPASKRLVTEAALAPTAKAAALSRKLVTSELVKAMGRNTTPLAGVTVTQNNSAQITGGTSQTIVPQATVASGSVPPISNSGTPNPQIQFSGGTFLFLGAGGGAQIAAPLGNDGTTIQKADMRPGFDSDGRSFEFGGAAINGTPNWSSFNVWINEQPICVPQIQAGTITSGSAVITGVDTSRLVVGQELLIAPGTVGVLPSLFGPAPYIGEITSTTVTVYSGVTGAAVAANATPTPPSLIAYGLIMQTKTWVKVDAGSASRGTPRRIVIEMSAYVGGRFPILYELHFAKTDSVTPPRIRTSRIYFIGDSYSGGAGALTSTQAWPIQFARSLGINDVWTSNGRGGTGVVTAFQTNGSFQHPNRIADTIAASPTADGSGYLVVIPASVNDPSAAGVQDGLVNIVTQVSTALPNAMFIFTEIMRPCAPTATDIAVNAAVAAAAAQLGSKVLGVIKSASLTPPAFSGTGSVTTPTGDGNADFYYAGGANTLHPTQDGANYIGRTIAAPQAAQLLNLAAGN